MCTKNSTTTHGDNDIDDIKMRRYACEGSKKLG